MRDTQERPSAVSIRMRAMAMALPPPLEPANIQFFRPMVDRPRGHKGVCTLHRSCCVRQSPVSAAPIAVGAI